MITDHGGGLLVLDKGDTETPDNGGTVFVSTSGARYKRQYNSGKVLLSWFGAVADYNPTTGIGTDIKEPLQAAVNFLFSIGGGKIIFPSGHWYLTPTVFINTNSQIPITLEGDASNVSYSKSDGNVKGAVIHIDQPGDVFRIGLDADGNRYYSSAAFLYKAFAVKNLSFSGENVMLGINVFRGFFMRTMMDNVSATHVDYLMLQTDTDAAGNQNYCDGSVYSRIKVYNSRYGGLKLIRCDETKIEFFHFEASTGTTQRGIEIKGASGVEISNVILGGNVTIPAMIPGSVFIDIENCKNPKLSGLHLEHSYFENAIVIRDSSQCAKVEGLYTKFESKNIFRFSGLVETVNINGWYSFGIGPENGYYDLVSVGVQVDDVTIDGLNLRDASQQLRELTKTGQFNVTQANTNNLLTTERIEKAKAFNELVRGQSIRKGSACVDRRWHCGIRCIL